MRDGNYEPNKIGWEAGIRTPIGRSRVLLKLMQTKRTKTRLGESRRSPAKSATPPQQK
jgi:hypothetical protein